MSGIKYWIWLTQRAGLSVLERQLLLERFGTPEGAYFADDGAYRLLEGLSGRALQSLKDKSMDEADKILGDCDRLGIHVTTMQDAVYPERLRCIHQPPMVLYWKGRELSADDEALIAIVGTRKCTPYGERMAAELSMDLTRSGAMVVSGMAEGIDAAAVRAALKAGGPVVSVLGGGMDVVYPWFHRELYEDVAAVGTLMSEYPPGTEHKGTHFPVRNRIISGLSVGVVVVESPRRGGSLLTAGHALDQDREVFAVPGPADAACSVGPNRLIQEGAAKLVMSAEDIICEFADRFPERFARSRPMGTDARAQRLKPQTAASAPAKRKKAAPQAENSAEPPSGEPGVEYIDWEEHKDKLTDDQREILRALEQGPRVADDIVELTQIPAQRVLAALTLLQVQGMVAEESGRRYRANIKIR